MLEALEEDEGAQTADTGAASCLNPFPKTSHRWTHFLSVEVSVTAQQHRLLQAESGTRSDRRMESIPADFLTLAGHDSYPLLLCISCIRPTVCWLIESCDVLHEHVKYGVQKTVKTDPDMSEKKVRHRGL